MNSSIKKLTDFLNIPIVKRLKYVVLISAIATLTLINSCTTVYTNYQDTDDLRWEKSDKKIFELNISEAGNYDLYFGMRYATGFPYRYIPIKFTEKLPSGKEREKEVRFMIISKNKKYQGDPLGQIWDFEAPFSLHQKMQKGEYSYTIEHTLLNETAPAVMEIGLVIKKADNK